MERCGVIILLTGESGTGKTTVCQTIAGRCRKEGIPCAGLLSLPLLDGQGKRIGIVGEDIASGERRTLALCDSRMDGPQVGRHTFDQTALDWASSALERAAASQAALLVVDEIGPLELELGGGLVGALPALAAWEGDLLIVVRPGCVSALLETIHFRQPVREFRLNCDNRADMPAQIWRLLSLGTRSGLAASKPYPATSSHV